jgi:DNA topoisomerase-2
VDGPLRPHGRPAAEQIPREFFTLRLDYYAKCRSYMIGLHGAEAAKLSNQARFILEKCKGDLIIENKKTKVMIKELIKKKYDKDPV